MVGVSLRGDLEVEVLKLKSEICYKRFFFYTHMLPLLFSIHNQFLIKTFKYLESKVFHLYLRYKKHKFIFLLETSAAIIFKKTISNL